MMSKYCTILYYTVLYCTVLQVCVQDFCEELEYWGLDDLHMEPCCQHTYYRARCHLRIFAALA